MFQHNVQFGLPFNIIYLQPVNIKVSFHIFTEIQTSNAQVTLWRCLVANMRDHAIRPCW